MTRARLSLEAPSDQRIFLVFAISRYDVAGGYLNAAGLAEHQPTRPPEEDMS